jgi:hypothetical protein
VDFFDIGVAFFAGLALALTGVLAFFTSPDFLTGAPFLVAALFVETRAVEGMDNSLVGVNQRADPSSPKASYARSSFSGSKLRI